jgi:phosphonopyruvate decarboxylase
MQATQGPYALLVKRQTFVKYKLAAPKPKYVMNREGALRELLQLLDARDIVVGTTGMLSRELFEERVRLGHGHEKDFLTVGSMGHASAIALGVSLAKPNRRVFVLDGDGAVLMHMGNMATIAAHGGPNFKHILINNEAHDSVGGQPTLCGNGLFSFRRVAEGCGYRKVCCIWFNSFSSSSSLL